MVNILGKETGGVIVALPDITMTWPNKALAWLVRKGNFRRRPGLLCVHFVPSIISQTRQGELSVINALQTMVPIILVEIMSV